MTEKLDKNSRKERKKIVKDFSFDCHGNQNSAKN